MPENQLLAHFPLVRSGTSLFCMMQKVGFKLVLILSFLKSCRTSCRIYTGPRDEGDAETSSEGDHGRVPAQLE